MSIKDKRKRPIEKKIDKAMSKIVVEDFPERGSRSRDTEEKAAGKSRYRKADEPEYYDEDESGYYDEDEAGESEYYDEDEPGEAEYYDEDEPGEAGYYDEDEAGESEYYDEDDSDGAEYDGESGAGYEDEESEDESDEEAGESEDEESDMSEYRGKKSRKSEYKDEESDASRDESDDESEADEENNESEYADDEETDESEYEDSEETDESEYEDSEETDASEYEEEVPAKSGKGKKKSSDTRKDSKSARPGRLKYVPMTEEDLETPEPLPMKKKHKGLKVTGIAAAMVVAAAGFAYAAASYYFSDRFFYGTTINGIDCSGKTAYEVEQLIAQQVENYSIQVLARNQEPETISGSAINYTYASDGEVLNLLKAQKPYEWIKGFFETSSYTTQKNATYDKNLLKTEVKALSCAQAENQVAPENAYVALSGNEFQIVPETEGSELNIKEAYKALDSAISGNQTSVDFNADSTVYVQAAVTSTDEALQATRDAYNNYTKASITYTFGDQSVTLDSGTLKDWLEFDEKGQLVSSDSSLQQHITEYVAQLAASYDTVGTTREFYTTSGRTVYVYGSAYGWKIDQAAEVEKLTEEIRSGSVTTRDPVYSMTANSRGTNDLGNTYIEVDLTAQHMYYYQNGSIIMDSDIVSGDMRYEDRKTPEGIYTLYYKKSPDTLKGKKLPDGTYEYETPVTYWMPFNGGIGFHDATWQPYFGGDRYLNGGSHGCINMPYDAAATLYNLIDYNVPIICFY